MQAWTGDEPGTNLADYAVRSEDPAGRHAPGRGQPAGPSARGRGAGDAVRHGVRTGGW